MQPLLFDTHAHYDDTRFDENRDELLSTLPSQGIGLVVNIGASLEGTQKSLELAEKYNHVYFTAGIHPDGVDSLSNPDRIRILKDCLKHEKCVAIGEIGLDYYYGKEEKERQLLLFEEQMKLADEYGMPVVIHDREAHGDCLEMIKRYPRVKGVFHCFSGSVELAKELFSLGWYISVGGVVTFANAKKLVEVVEALPTLGTDAMSRLLLETDCPYLAPVPFRGKTNHSGYMKYTAERVAQLLGIEYDELCMKTYENGLRFYGLEGKTL